MNPTSKKLISLFLVFSLVMLSVHLYAKERRGAKLLITKKDGQQIKGELITVKPNSLLLLDTEGKDVSVDIEEIKVIRIVKKSKALLGIGTGLLGGAGSGAVIGASLWVLGLPVMAIFGEAGIESWKDDFQDFLWNGALIGAGVWVLLGAITGALLGTDKTIHFEGMTDSEISEALDKLRKKARIPDYK